MLAQGKAETELIDRLRIKFAQDVDAFNFIESMVEGSDYMETLRDLHERRGSHRGSNNIRKALLGILNGLTN